MRHGMDCSTSAMVGFGFVEPNAHRNPIDNDIPPHSALAASIGAVKAGGQMTSLLKDFGKPPTANGFGN